MENIQKEIHNFKLSKPILFITFNRLNTTKLVFEEIKKVKPPRLYISSDAPRKDKNGEDKKVKLVREYILNNINWECEINTLFQESNLGCRLACSDAVSWFFENEEMGIILEDDCLPSESFFRFCEELLEKYKDDTRVMHIGGSNYINIDSNYDYWFSNYPLMWGWATWRRSWRLYDVNMKNFKKFQAEKLKDSCFNTIQERKHFFRGFYKMYTEKYDSWDIQWFFSCIANNGLSIIPKKNMIKNIGFGIDATHTTNEKNKLANLKACEINFPLKHPIFVLSIKSFDIKLFNYTFYINYFFKFKYKLLGIFNVFKK